VIRSTFLKFVTHAKTTIPFWMVMLITSVLPEIGPTTALRGFFIRYILKSRPKGLRIGRNVTIVGAGNLEVGDNVYLASGTWINAIGGVCIGNEVTISPYVVIASTSHVMENGTAYGTGVATDRIEIGAGSWIASHSVLCRGAIVGTGCIVGAGSVVTKPLQEANMSIFGAPAKAIKPVAHHVASQFGVL